MTRFKTNLVWYKDLNHEWELARYNNDYYYLLWSKEYVSAYQDLRTKDHFLTRGEFWGFNPELLNHIGMIFDNCPPCKIQILDVLDLSSLKAIKYTQDERAYPTSLSLYIVLSNYRPLFPYKEVLDKMQNEI